MKQYKDRNEVPDHEKWDLTDLYSSIDDWEKDYQQVEGLVGEIAAYNGAIQNGKDLLDYLTKNEETDAIFTNIYVYAMLLGDLDTRESLAQNLLAKARTLSVKLSEAGAFFMPYLLSLDEETLRTYIKEQEGLQYFEKDLWDAFRYKNHTLNKEQEELLSKLGETFSAPNTTFQMFNNADIQFGEVSDGNGDMVELTRGMYSKLIEDTDRNVRKEAYKAYYKPYLQYANVIASTLSANIKNNVVRTKIRNYSSALEKALFADKVPVEVYENLIETTRKNLDAKHRYNEIRKEILGLEQLKPYDLSVDLVEGVKQDISYHEAYETMLKALHPLGEEYLSILSSFRDKRYVDVRETPGKRSGAYNLGVYGVHPFILLNHHDDIDSQFTLVHEMGHAMHSYYSSTYQPRISAGYSIFVAEVASTVNEVLLIHYLLKETTDPKKRKYLLNYFIDQFNGTFFTQVMFSEFEKITHEKAEQGEPLNKESFNQIYGQLSNAYSGDVVEEEEETAYGWSRIPHFYRPFYVYKYATGFVSAIHLAGELLKGNKEVQASYLEFLKSGSSEYPLDLLKKAGVDLTSPEPINNAMKQYRELIEEFASL
ncbi:oligoendopeptidase F [Pradoshia sp.]|uniref:oligoendopeptidase F n=1 Tax=Pradoshia sp. TaxID=2651281 RepID=UPI003F064F1A